LIGVVENNLLWIYAIVIFTIVPLLVGFFTLLVTGKGQCHQNRVALLFHSISSCRNTHASHFSPKKFQQFADRVKTQGVTTRTLRQSAENSEESIRDMVITFDDAFESFYTIALPILNALGIKVTIFPIAGFIGKSSEWDVLPKQLHMSALQIREAASGGHEIGSHTLTHANLTMLDTKDLYTELHDSKHILEDLIGVSVTSLSFPFGCWNTRIWEKALEIGYTQATCYRHHGRIIPGLFPVRGIYAFDTVDEVFQKTDPCIRFSNTIARCRVMSHFAKGTPLWNFRSNYKLIRS
jgi:peptidoglycan/xylan/chitin deacetylase (PgdA/CDA1 family)